MQLHEDLLNQARPFCNPETGEVVRRLPDEIMQQLRAAKLARGIPCRRSQNTQTYATWFVFFNDQIRDRVLREFREANTKRKPERKDATKADSPTTASSPSNVSGSSPPLAQRGLGQFRRMRPRSK